MVQLFLHHHHRFATYMACLYNLDNILRVYYSQMHLLAEMDAKESVGGGDIKPTELWVKLENEKCNFERFRALGNNVEERSEQ